MKNKYYFVRFDDICSTMDMEQFSKAKDLMDRYHIQPLIGVIPDNHDPEQMKNEADPSFWEKIRNLQEQGWSVAMHGCHHVYNQENPKTMICGKKHSEFAGNSYEKQFEMIKTGKKCLESHGISTNMFFAPAHTYDKNTLRALATNGFKYNVDGLSRKPYKQCGIINIPCRSFGVPRKCRDKINVAINHSSEWTRDDKAYGYEELRSFCENHEKEITNFSAVSEIPVGNFMMQKISEKSFYLYSKLRQLARKIIKG